LPPAQGGLPEWKVETKSGSGKGTLSLVVAPDGSITGEASGPLGAQEVRGTVEGEALTARLFPAAGVKDGYTGTVIAHREGEAFVGSLEASTADGRQSRSGTVSLRKR
jgi:hypothetical protein